MFIDFKCEIKKGVSEKTKKPYTLLTINELGKTVYLTPTEEKLLSFIHPYTPPTNDKVESKEK